MDKVKKVLFTATVDSHILQFHIPYLKMFKDMGYETYVATNSDEAIPYCDKKYKISFERSPFKLNNLKAIKQLKKVVEEEKFDIIHCHTPMGSVVTRLASKHARKAYGTRVIYTAHGFHFYKGAPKINWLIFYPVEKYLSKYTDDLITINNEDYELAIKKFKAKRTHYVPGVGVDPKKFDFELSQEERHELRKSLGIKDDDFVMIFPARLDKNKNQILLIEFMKRVLKKYSNVHLLLPGVDETNGFCEKIIVEEKITNIHLLGYRKDIPKLLKISDLALSSSKREGLGLNLIEAIYCGLPVLALDNRGHRDIIVNGQNGYIISQKDPINELLYFFTEKINNGKKFKTNKKTIDRFLIDNVMKKMKKIYFKEIKILFAHDGYIKKGKDNKYYVVGGIGGKEITKKYLLDLNGKLIYYTRYDVLDECDTNKYIQLDLDSVELRCSKIYNGPLDMFLKYFKLKKEAKLALYDVDYCVVRLPSVLGSILFNEARSMNIPTFVEMVGCPYESLIYYGGLKGYLFAPILKNMTKKSVRNAKYVHYVTKDFLQKRYPNKDGRTLSCSDVVVNDVSYKILEDRINKIKNKKENEVVKLGLVGSLDVNYKGHEVCIKAISKLKDKYNIELHFLGEGNKERWENLAKEYGVEKNIFFDGTLESGDPVMKWYDDLDIHLMMSKTEGLPRVLVEAMSRASISIASNVGGIPELIDTENLLDKDDVDGLASKIEELINNKEEQIKIAKRNFNKAKEYEYKKLSKKREEFYKEFIEKESK